MSRDRCVISHVNSACSGCHDFLRTDEGVRNAANAASTDKQTGRKCGVWVGHNNQKALRGIPIQYAEFISGISLRDAEHIRLSPPAGEMSKRTSHPPKSHGRHPATGPQVG